MERSLRVELNGMEVRQRTSTQTTKQVGEKPSFIPEKAKSYTRNVIKTHYAA